MKRLLPLSLILMPLLITSDVIPKVPVGEKCPGQLTEAYTQFMQALTLPLEARALAITHLETILREEYDSCAGHGISPTLYETLSNLYLFELRTQCSQKRIRQLAVTMQRMYCYTLPPEQQLEHAHPFRYALLITLLEAFKVKSLPLNGKDRNAIIQHTRWYIDEAWHIAAKSPCRDHHGTCKPAYKQMKLLANTLMNSLQPYLPEQKISAWPLKLSSLSSAMLKLGALGAVCLPLYACFHLYYFHGDQLANSVRALFHRGENMLAHISELTDNIADLTTTIEKKLSRNL